jgi:hypothetical protein
MPPTDPTDQARRTARAAGVLYLAIIACGLTAELAVRGTLIHPSDPAATAAAIGAATGLFRLGLALDLVMVACDVGLAVLLYLLLRPLGRGLVLGATAMRLSQASVIAFGMLGSIAAMLLLTRPDLTGALPAAEVAALAALALELHAHAYDLGLVFFGVNCLLLGALFVRSSALPRALGYTLGAAGVVYLVGSSVRFFAPQHLEAVQVLYAIPVIAEVWMMGWLLRARVPRAAGALAGE